MQASAGVRPVKCPDEDRWHPVCLADEGIDQVRRGSRPVLVGLGDDDIVARRSKVDKLAILGARVGGLAILVEASEVLVGNVEVEVALIQDPDRELTVGVGADIPVDDSIDVGGDGMAAQHGLLLVLEGDARLPSASAVHGGVVVGVGDRAEARVVHGPGSA